MKERLKMVLYGTLSGMVMLGVVDAIFDAGGGVAFFTCLALGILLSLFPPEDYKSSAQKETVTPKRGGSSTDRLKDESEEPIGPADDSVGDWMRIFWRVGCVAAFWIAVGHYAGIWPLVGQLIINPGALLGVAAIAGVAAPLVAVPLLVVVALISGVVLLVAQGIEYVVAGKPKDNQQADF